MVGAKDLVPVEKPEDLRKLAEWYRSMAEVGHSDHCAWRRRFADYLEKRAAEIESLGHRGSVTPDRRYVILRT